MNDKLLRLKFEPSTLKTPVNTLNWELPTAIMCLVTILTVVLILGKLGLIYNSMSGN